MGARIDKVLGCGMMPRSEFIRLQKHLNRLDGMIRGRSSICVIKPPLADRERDPLPMNPNAFLGGPSRGE